MIDEKIKKMIFLNLYGEERLYFRPSWIVNKGISRYAVNKAVKVLKECQYIKYVTLGGGCNEDYEAQAPWNGYKLTKLGEEWFSEK